MFMKLGIISCRPLFVRYLFFLQTPGVANVANSLFGQNLLPRSVTSVITANYSSKNITEPVDNCYELASVSDASVLKILDDFKPTHVITGTSHYNSWDSIFWRHSKHTNIKHIALLDSWFNMNSRFENGTPDCIGAIDSSQKSILSQLGISEEKILVIGHPFISKIKSYKSSFEIKNKDKINILFISEPISNDVQIGSNIKYGFTEQDSFDLLLKSVSNNNQVEKIVVKLHPHEDSDLWDKNHQRRQDKTSIKISYANRDPSSQDFLEQFDLACGISSMLMIETMALGIPIISIQPNLSREDTFIASNRKFVPRIDDNFKDMEFLYKLSSDYRQRKKLMKKERAFFDDFNDNQKGSLKEWLSN